MGNAHNSHLSDEDAERFSEATGFAKKEIMQMHHQWAKKEGGLSKKDVLGVVEKLGLLGQIMSCWATGPRSQAAIDEKTQEAVLADAEVKEILADLIYVALDKDANGMIDFEELVQGLAIMTHGTAEEQARLHFRVVDLDKDGKLSKKEMIRCVDLQQRAMTAGFKLGLQIQQKRFLDAGLTKEQLEELIEKIRLSMERPEIKNKRVDVCFKYADKDGDGFIQEDEYVSFQTDPATIAAFKEEVKEITAPLIGEMTEIVKGFVNTALYKAMDKQEEHGHHGH